MAGGSHRGATDRDDAATIFSTLLDLAGGFVFALTVGTRAVE